MGSKTTQQGSTASTTTPAGLAQLQSIYSKVADAASQPYNPYTGELTAGVNDQQQTGINNINANANYAQPYIQQAGTLASGAANPLTAAQIQQYQNPYTQNVVNATQAQFNNANGVQQQQVKGNAALAGALGGDRQAVAQAELANQQQLAQAPVIAGLYSNAYNSGLSTATNQFQTNPLAAASSLGNIGVAGQNSALAGAQAQVAGGTLQQQTQQAADTANLGQYNQAQAFPYQQAQYLASIGAPIASAEGTTTNGTSSTQTNPFAQYAGLGIAGAGLFLKDGGTVPHMATGGSPFNFITDSGGYIPQTQPLNLKAPTASTSPSAASSGSSTANPWASATSGLSNMKGIFGGDSNTMGSPGVDSPLSVIGGAGDYAVPTFMSHGGLVEAVHAIRKGIDRANGGAVSGYGQPSNGIYIPHMADGGDPATFDERFGFPFQNTDNSPIIPDPGLQQVSPQAMDAWRSGVDTPNPAIAANDDTAAPPIAPDTPLTRSAGLPPQITGQPDNTTPDESSSALGYNGSPVLNPALTGNSSVTPVAAQQPQTFGHSLFGVNLSDKTRQGLIAAGLAMAASKNPSFVGALGEGGLKGLGAYSDATKAEQEAADKKLTQSQSQTRIDMEAKRIAQSAEQFSKTDARANRTEKRLEDKTPSGYRQTDNGNYEPIPGGPADPATLKAAAEAKRTGNAVLDDDTIHDMADQYLAGDRTVLQNLGRGAQGAENIVKIRQAIAKQARDSGVDPKGIVQNFNEQAGALAGQRAVGTRAANISLAANEANNMIPIALAASDKLPRTQYMPWNQMVQSVQKGSSSPELASFVAATNSLVNSYVRAVSPSGVPTDSMRQHAYDMLNAAQGPEAYKSVVNTMKLEMNAALAAPSQVKKELRGEGQHSEAPPAAAPVTGLVEGRTGTDAQGRKVIVRNGQIVPL